MIAGSVPRCLFEQYTTLRHLSPQYSKQLFLLVSYADRVFLRSKMNIPITLQIPNPIHPGLMSAEERIAEIGELLARGLVRLRARNASPLSADRGDSFVDFPPHQSGHAETPTRSTA